MADTGHPTFAEIMAMAEAYAKGPHQCESCERTFVGEGHGTGATEDGLWYCNDCLEIGDTDEHETTAAILSDHHDTRTGG